MNKQAIIEHTIKAIESLPVEQAEEISDFADYLIKRHNEQSLLQAGYYGSICASYFGRMMPVIT
ncbi:MAG TPA: hypothetical protein VGN64_21340, partial [Dyadobacter sp.]|nr:hypothetical protein [Dyadobacter sp.]